MKNPFICLSRKDIEEILSFLKIEKIEDLFKHIPESLKISENLVLEGLSEQDTYKKIEEISQKNKIPESSRTFLGGGAYNHYIPSIIDHIVERSEFLTSYTPYQPEVSQGTLQAIFEFQTLLCQLTGMEISNASLYDGATSLVEAVFLGTRIYPERKVIWVSETLNPEYREVLKTYIQNFDYKLVVVPKTEEGTFDLKWIEKNISKDVLCFCFGYPNYFGIIEPVKEAVKILEKEKIITISCTSEMLSLGILKTPGELGVEIACGEGQSLGIPLSFGGPYLGILSTKEAHLRRMPGRIVGETEDREGKRGYVLTISTREQHIRREKATSNICTNQSLCALRACIYMALLGKEGYRELAQINAKRAYGLYQRIEKFSVFKKPFFNEFVVKIKNPEKLQEKGFYFGPPLEKDYPDLKDCYLIATTELNSKDSILEFAKAMEEL
ncbi:MAG: aminomethyl-transferring glycine dehydrogenase subunit GcvPA [Thermoanaerobaculia bacterium]